MRRSRFISFRLGEVTTMMRRRRMMGLYDAGYVPTLD